MGISQEEVEYFSAFRRGYHFDEMSDDIVRRLGGNFAIARRSRARGDFNRPSLPNAEERKELIKKVFRIKNLNMDGEPISAQIFEFSTSARAALYWLIERSAEKMGILTKDGKLSEPLMIYMIHSLKDSKISQDVILAGGRLPGKNNPSAISLMDERLLHWLAEQMVSMGKQLGLMVDANGEKRDFRVGVHRAGRWHIRVYKDDKGRLTLERINMQNIDGKGTKVKRLAAVTSGLHHFREGAIIESEFTGYDGKKKEFKIPGFGDNLHLIQLDICQRARKSGEVRGRLIQILDKIRDCFRAEKWKEKDAIDLPDAWGTLDTS